jgi:Zn-dependent protease
MLEMMQLGGAIKLFRVLGVTVYMHWTWLLIVALGIWQRQALYQSSLWPAVEVLSLFGIVLVHEFGHALACRSVGGKAESIMLWPLGGVAFVSPPMRPGALLWSIFAGPLVNIILLPITILLLMWSASANVSGDVHRYLLALTWMNGALLLFNILPIYPLDGGQILQALLWYVIGYVRSLKVVSVIGLIGAGGLILLAARLGLGPMTYIIAMFIGIQALTGYSRARLMAQSQARGGDLSGEEAGFTEQQGPGQPGGPPERRPVAPPPLPPAEEVLPPRRNPTPPPLPGNFRPPQW